MICPYCGKKLIEIEDRNKEYHCKNCNIDILIVIVS